MANKSKKPADGWLESIISDLKVQDTTEAINGEAPRRAYKSIRRRGVRRHTEEKRKELKRAEDRKARLSLRGRLRQLRKHAKYRGIELTLTFDEWVRLWEAAGEVFFQGRMVPAFTAYTMRKRLNPDVPYELSDGCQLRRVDCTRGYSLDNVKIIYGKRTLVRGYTVKPEAE